MGVDEPYLRMLQHIYSNKRFFVRDPFGESDVRPQNTGLAQGDSLSCVLLNLLTTVIMHDAEQVWRRDFDQSVPSAHEFREHFAFDHVLYADDTNLVNTSLFGLRFMLHAVEKEAKRYGLTLNMSKTALLRLGIAKKRPTPNLRSLDGSRVKEKDIDYTLGFPLGARGTNKRMVGERISAMTLAMNQYKLIWTSKMSTKKKIEKYQSLVLSKATWGLHLLALGKTEFKKLEYYHIRCLRRILGIKASYISRVSNDDVLKKANFPCFRSFVRLRQFQLLGHVLRLTQDDPDFRVCFQVGTLCDPCLPVPFKRRKGRPRARWAEVLISDFIEQYPNQSRQDIYHLAQDRSRWRAATLRLSL